MVNLQSYTWQMECSETGNINDNLWSLELLLFSTMFKDKYTN
jgi:hypothetical protein